MIAPDLVDVDNANLRVPAEWEPQAAVWLAWPHHRTTWPHTYESLPGMFARWARLIAESTPVRVLAPDAHIAEAQRKIGDHPEITLIEIATNDTWIRDYGPTFVRNTVNSRIHAVDWRFNAWGGKYRPWDSDDAAAVKMCEWAGIDHISDTLCLEGGAMETDGSGRLIVTTECLVTDTRNPGWDGEAIAERLHLRLGVTEIVWLDGGGLVGDDTDGHIDQLARFIDSKNVVVAVCDDPEDPNHVPLENNYRQLKLWGRSTKPKVDVHRLPIPPRRTIGSQRVPESYCNFLMLGPDRILVPTFGHTPSDEFASALLRELRSSAEVTGVDCRDLIGGFGALHCASRDQPR
jgi:agmatine deiminase